MCLDSHTHLFLPVFDLVVVFSEGGLGLLDAEPDTEGLLLQRVLLLLQDLYLLQHPLILLLHFRECSLEDKARVLSLFLCVNRSLDFYFFAFF